MLWFIVEKILVHYLLKMLIKQHLQTKNKSIWKNTCEYIVLHHTWSWEGTIKWVLNRLTVWPVSCHFVCDINWDIYKIWEDTDILWHAWVSEWDGKKDMNKYSIWIEIIWPLPWFTDEQRASVRILVSELLKKHNLIPSRIIRHKDCSPWRKTDVHDSFWSEEYKTFFAYQSSYDSTTNTSLMEDNTTVSEFKQVYIQERPNGYKPRFSDFSGNKPATISDVKYLIEINNIRNAKQ